MNKELTTNVYSVVFVHGLNGDAFKTWSAGKVCWPKDLLPQDLENARILTVSLQYHYGKYPPSAC